MEICARDGDNFGMYYTNCMNINTAHYLLGHRNEDSTRKTAKQMGWELTRGSLKPFKCCTKSKTKQKIGFGSQKGHCIKTHTIFGPVRAQSSQTLLKI